jgi:hypothetical protein
MVMVGGAMVLLFVLFLSMGAMMLAPFGAVRFVWGLVSAGWDTLLACGLLLLGSAAWLFRRASKQKAERRLAEFD